MHKKNNKQYYFSTEGETEQWYLEHLAKLINNNSQSCNTVSFKIKKAQPISFVKQLSVISPATIFHLFDFEAYEQSDIKHFEKVIDDMKKSESIGKKINYKNGYTNLTFELWLILHKMDCNHSISDRKDYLPLINKAFNVNYQGLKEYKEENHFKNILAKITINDVKAAVNRADKIMHNNQINYKEKTKYKYSWYDENPATEVGTIIKEILINCGLFP